MTNYEALHGSVQRENNGLRAELEITNKLLDERNRLLDAIPKCNVHGACIPHAIEWVKSTNRYIEDLEQGIPAEAFKAMKTELDRLREIGRRALAIVTFVVHQHGTDTYGKMQPGWEGATETMEALEEALALDTAKEPSDGD